jgi:hypothetical protein
MMGQAKLMEIIDQAYDNADTCDNCKALSEWWEKHGSMPQLPGVVKHGEKRRRS